jgi:hypothetical protein
MHQQLPFVVARILSPADHLLSVNGWLRRIHRPLGRARIFSMSFAQASWNAACREISLSRLQFYQVRYSFYNFIRIVNQGLKTAGITGFRGSEIKTRRESAIPGSARIVRR